MDVDALIVELAKSIAASGPVAGVLLWVVYQQRAQIKELQDALLAIVRARAAKQDEHA